ncbi:MAG: FecR family protein [Bryobacteraceae bacterium]|nr:FecR family protein [Bryobacteraceae bacterium]
MQDDQYLWDRTGEPDPLIARLEQELRPYAARPFRPQPRRSSWRWIAAIAATLLLGATWQLTRPTPSAWQLDSGRRVALGERVSTGPGQRAVLSANGVGTVRLDPGSALQVMAAPPGLQRLALAQGTLHAFIFAPAKSFQVDTPAGTSIDLGCAYTLTVDERGAGLVSVSTGWVAFQTGPRESFIPAGAACRTRRDAGPGLPYFTDAPLDFLQSVVRWEDSGDLAGLLAAARPRDGLTLWHLLQRTTSPRERNLVVQRFAVLIPGLDIAGLNRGDAAAINQAWDALGLGATGWWRSWKHPWAG